jgi:phospho-N-acetylmuramoyl-pentapeptide-transferase
MSLIKEFFTFQNEIEVFNLAKILGFASVAFIFAFILTPLLTKFLYKYKLGKQIRTEGAPVFAKMHAKKAGTPTMGGILIWGTVLVITLFFWFLAQATNNSFLDKLNFLTRAQTLLPLGALVISGLVGIFDDILGVKKIGPKGGGLSMLQRIIIYLLVALGGAWWFYFKLDFDLIHVPGIGDFNIGWWYIPIFIFIIVASSFSANETDGIDGLAGGVLGIAFGSMAVISYVQGRIDLAIFCGLICGALLAFLWFNIYPARFFMGDTGSMSLGVTLGVICMLTNSIFILPFIAFILVVESGSVILQMFSKKIFHKKLFHSTPIHHHFEARGWPESKVTMRFWIVGAVVAAIGLVIGLIGQG